MAYGVSFDAASGTITIQGDDAQDFAVVEWAYNNPNSPLDDQLVVTHNQQPHYFSSNISLDPVKKIVFLGFGCPPRSCSNDTTAAAWSSSA